MTVLTRTAAIVAASAAAEAVFRNVGKAQVVWYRYLAACQRIEDLAAYLERHPASPAEALYREGLGDSYKHLPWGADVPLQAAVTTFHAVLLPLLKLVPAPAAEPAPPPRPNAFGQRTLERRKKGLRGRVKLTKAAADKKEPARPAPPAEASSVAAGDTPAARRPPAAGSAPIRGKDKRRQRPTSRSEVAGDN